MDVLACRIMGADACLLASAVARLPSAAAGLHGCALQVGILQLVCGCMPFCQLLLLRDWLRQQHCLMAVPYRLCRVYAICGVCVCVWEHYLAAATSHCQPTS